MSRLRCPSPDRAQGQGRPITPYPPTSPRRRVQAEKNFHLITPEFLRRDDELQIQQIQNFSNAYELPCEQLEDIAQPFFEDIPADSSFEEVSFRYGSPPQRGQADMSSMLEAVQQAQSQQSQQPQQQTTPQVCPPPPKAPSPLVIPPPPKNPKDRKAYVARAKAIHEKQRREGTLFKAPPPTQTGPVVLPQAKGRQPISRWPGGRPPRPASKCPAPQAQAPRKQATRGQTSQAQAPPSKGTRSQPATRSKRMVPKKKPKPLPPQPGEYDKTPPLSPKHCEAVARARKLAGLRSSRPELNPAVAARIAAEKAEAERFAALPEYEKIQERMARVRKMPTRVRRRINLSPSVLGMLEGIRATMPQPEVAVPAQPSICPTPVAAPLQEYDIPEEMSPLAPFLKPSEPPPPAPPDYNLPEKLALRRPRRQLKYDTSPECPRPLVLPPSLPQLRKWQPAVRKMKHQKSRIWRKQFPRVFAGTKKKGSRRLDVMDPLAEDEELEMLEEVPPAEMITCPQRSPVEIMQERMQSPPRMPSPPRVPQVCPLPERPQIISVEELPPIDMTSYLPARPRSPIQTVTECPAEVQEPTDEFGDVLADLDKWEKEYADLDEDYEREMREIEAEEAEEIVDEGDAYQREYDALIDQFERELDVSAEATTESITEEEVDDEEMDEFLQMEQMMEREPPCPQIYEQLQQETETRQSPQRLSPQEVTQSIQAEAVPSKGAIPRMKPSAEVISEWERIRQQAKALYASPAKPFSPPTEEEALDEFEELEQMFEHIEGETPTRHSIDPSVCPPLQTEKLMQMLLSPSEQAAIDEQQMTTLSISEFEPPVQDEPVPTYLKYADFKHRQESIQRRMEEAEAQAIASIEEECPMSAVEQQLHELSTSVDWSLAEGPEEPMPISYAPEVCPPQQVCLEDVGVEMTPIRPTIMEGAQMPLFDLENYDFFGEFDEEIADISQPEVTGEDISFEEPCIEDTSAGEMIDLSMSGTEVDLEDIQMLDEEQMVEPSEETTRPGFLASVVGTVVDTVKNIFARSPKESETTDEEGAVCANLDSSLPNMFESTTPSPQQQQRLPSPPRVENIVCAPPPQEVPPCPKPESPIIVPPPPKSAKDRKAFVERAKAIYKLQQREAAKAPPPPPADAKSKKREIKSSIPKARAPLKRKPKKKKPPPPKEYPPGFSAELSPTHCAAVARARQLAGLKRTTLQLNPELHARIAAKKAAKLAAIEAKRQAREEELAAEEALPGPERFRSRMERLRREGHPPPCPRPTLDTLGRLEAIRHSLAEPDIGQRTILEEEGETDLMQFSPLRPAEKLRKLQYMKDLAAQRQQPQTCPSFHTEDLRTPPPPVSPIRWRSPPRSPKRDEVQRERTLYTIGPHGGQETTKQTVVETSTFQDGEIRTDVRTITTKTDEFGNVTCHVQEGTGEADEENLANIAPPDFPEFEEDIPSPIDNTVPTPGEIIERIRRQVREKLSASIDVCPAATAAPATIPCLPQLPTDFDEEDLSSIPCPLMEDGSPPRALAQDQEISLDSSLPKVFAETPPPPSPPRAPSPSRAPSPVRTPSCPQPRPPSPIVIPKPPKDPKDRKAFVERAKAIHKLQMRQQAEAAAAGITTAEPPKKKGRQPISRWEKKGPAARPLPRGAPSRGAQVASRRRGLGVKKKPRPPPPVPGEYDHPPPISPQHCEAVARARKLAGLKSTRPELNKEVAARLAAEKAEAERFAALSEYEKIQDRMARLRTVPPRKRKISQVSPTTLGALAAIRSNMPCPIQTEETRVEKQPSPQKFAAPQVAPAQEMQPPRKRGRIVLPSQERELERERLAEERRTSADPAIRWAQEFRDKLESQTRWTPTPRRYKCPRSDLYRKRFRTYRGTGKKGSRPLHVMSPIAEFGERPQAYDEELQEFECVEREIEELDEFEAAEAQAEAEITPEDVAAAQMVLEKAAMQASIGEIQGDQVCLPEVPTFQPKYSSVPDWVAQHYQEEIQEFVTPPEEVSVSDNLLEPYMPTASVSDRFRMIKEAQERARISAAAAEEYGNRIVEEASTVDVEYEPLLLMSPTGQQKITPLREQLIDVEGPPRPQARRIEDLAEGCPVDVDFLEYEEQPDLLDVPMDEPITPPPKPADILNRIRAQVLQRRQEEADRQRAVPSPPMQPFPEDLTEEDICDVDESILLASPPVTPPSRPRLDTSLPTIFGEPPQPTPSPRTPSPRRVPSPARPPPEVCPPQPTQPSPIIIPKPPKDPKDRKAFVERAKAIHKLQMRQQAEAAAAGITTAEPPKKKGRQPISRWEKKGPAARPLPRGAPSRGAQVASRRRGLGVKKKPRPPPPVPGEYDHPPPISPQHCEAVARARKLAGLKSTRPELNKEVAARLAAEKAEAERFAALSEYEKIQERMQRVRKIPVRRRKRIDVSPTVLGTLEGIRATTPYYSPPPRTPVRAPSPPRVCPPAPIRAPTIQQVLSPEQLARRKLVYDTSPTCPAPQSAQYLQTPVRAPSPPRVCPPAPTRAPTIQQVLSPEQLARRKLVYDTSPTCPAPQPRPKWQPAVRKVKHPQSQIWRKRYPRVFAGTRKKGSRKLDVMESLLEDEECEMLESEVQESQPIVEFPPSPECPVEPEPTGDDVDDALADFEKWEKEFADLNEDYEREMREIEAEGEEVVDEGDAFQTEYDALIDQLENEFDAAASTLDVQEEAEEDELDAFIQMEQIMAEVGQEPCPTDVYDSETVEEETVDEFEELEQYYESLEGETPIRSPEVPPQEVPGSFDGYTLEEQMEEVPCPAAPAVLEEIRIDPRERYRQIVERHAAPRAPSPPPSPITEPDIRYSPLTLTSPTTGRVQKKTTQITSSGLDTVKEQVVETSQIVDGKLQQVVTQVVTTTDPNGNINYQINQNRHVSARDIQAEEDLCAIEEPPFLDVTPDYIEERPRPADIIERIRREVMEGKRPEGRPEVPTAMLIDIRPTPPPLPLPQVTPQDDLFGYTCPTLPQTPPTPPRAQRASPVTQVASYDLDSSLPEMFIGSPSTLLPPTPPPAQPTCPPKPPTPKPRPPSPIIIPKPPKDPKDRKAFVERAKAIHKLQMRQQAEAAAAGITTAEPPKKKGRQPISRWEKKGPAARPLPRGAPSRGAQVASRRKALGVKKKPRPPPPVPGEYDHPPPISPQHCEAVARARKLAGLKSTRPELNKAVAARLAAEKAEAERFAALSEYEKIQDRMQKARAKGIKRRKVKPSAEAEAYLESLKLSVPLEKRYELIRRRSPVPPTTQYPHISPRSRYRQIIEQRPPTPCPSPFTMPEVQVDYEPLSLQSPDRPNIPPFELEGLEDVGQLETMEEPSFMDVSQDVQICPSPRTPMNIFSELQQRAQQEQLLRAPSPSRRERPPSPLIGADTPLITKQLPLPKDLPEEDLLDYSFPEFALSPPQHTPLASVLSSIQERVQREQGPLRAPSPTSRVRPVSLAEDETTPFIIRQENVCPPNLPEGDLLDYSIPTYSHTPPLRPTARTLDYSLPTIFVESPPRTPEPPMVEAAPTTSLPGTLAPPVCPQRRLKTPPIVVPPPPKDPKDRAAYVMRARAIHQLQQQQAAREAAMGPPQPPQKPGGRVPISRRPGGPPRPAGKPPAATKAAGRAVSAAKTTKPPVKKAPTKKSGMPLKRPPLKKKGGARSPCPTEPPPFPPGHVEAVMRARQLAGIKPKRRPSVSPRQPTQPVTQKLPTPPPPAPREPPTFESLMARAASLKGQAPPRQALTGRQQAAAQHLINLRQREERMRQLGQPQQMPSDAEFIIQTPPGPQERFKAIRERQVAAAAAAREPSPVRIPTSPEVFYVPHCPIELADTPPRDTAPMPMTFEQELLEDQTAPEFHEDYETPVKECVAEATQLNREIAALHDEILRAPKKRVHPRGRRAGRRRYTPIIETPGSLRRRLTYSPDHVPVIPDEDIDEFMALEAAQGITPAETHEYVPQTDYVIAERVLDLEKELSLSPASYAKAQKRKRKLIFGTPPINPPRRLVRRRAEPKPKGVTPTPIAPRRIRGPLNYGTPPPRDLSILAEDVEDLYPQPQDLSMFYLQPNRPTQQRSTSDYVEMGEELSDQPIMSQVPFSQAAERMHMESKWDKCMAEYGQMQQQLDRGATAISPDYYGDFNRMFAEPRRGRQTYSQMQSLDYNLPQLFASPEEVAGTSRTYVPKFPPPRFPGTSKFQYKAPLTQITRPQTVTPPTAQMSVCPQGEPLLPEDEEVMQAMAELRQWEKEYAELQQEQAKELEEFEFLEDEVGARGGDLNLYEITEAESAIQKQLEQFEREYMEEYGEDVPISPLGDECDFKLTEEEDNYLEQAEAIGVSSEVLPVEEEEDFDEWLANYEAMESEFKTSAEPVPPRRQQVVCPVTTRPKLSKALPKTQAPSRVSRMQPPQRQPLSRPAPSQRATAPGRVTTRPQVPPTSRAPRAQPSQRAPIAQTSRTQVRQVPSTAACPRPSVPKQPSTSRVSRPQAPQVQSTTRVPRTQVPSTTRVSRTQVPSTTRVPRGQVPSTASCPKIPTTSRAPPTQVSSTTRVARPQVTQVASTSRVTRTASTARACVPAQPSGRPKWR